MPKSAMSIKEAVLADPEHYSVDLSNEKVRAVRIKYGPHEKSVMHSHDKGVLIFLTDQRVRFTYPDGSSEETMAKAGECRWSPAGSHLPENLEDKPLELIYVEVKG